MALTSQIRHVEVLDTSVTTGAGLTGKIHSDFTAAYCIDGGTLVSLTTETITTLGTYQAPTSSAHIRIKELNSADPTKGMYEVHFHNSQLSSGTRLWLYMSVAGGKVQRLEVDLQDVKNVNVAQWLGTAPATPTVAGVPEVDVTHVAGSAEDIATEAKQNTAQADLDILTGTDGATLATSQPNYAPATSAQATAIEADTQDLQTQIGTAGAGLTGIPKAGYKLASDGLDVIDATIPSAVATTFPGFIKQLWARFMYKSTLSSTELITYASDGTTVVTTQTVSDTGTLQTQGKAS